MRTTTVYRWSRVVSLIVILMLLLIAWLEIVPSNFLRHPQYYVDAGFQRERGRLFVNSAYNLEYRSTLEHAQAIGDLEISLPLFQQEQALLWRNDDPDVQTLLYQAQPDYLAIVADVQTILAVPANPINATVFLSILAHEQNFFLPMNRLIEVLAQEAQWQHFFFWIIQLSAESCGVLSILALLLFDRHLRSAYT